MMATMTTDLQAERRSKLGTLVAERRRELGLTIDRAAELAGISHVTWGRIERGESVRATTIRSIDSVLGWGPDMARDFLLLGDDAPLIKLGSAAQTSSTYRRSIQTVSGRAVRKTEVLPDSDGKISLRTLVRALADGVVRTRPEGDPQPLEDAALLLRSTDGLPDIRFPVAVVQALMVAYGEEDELGSGRAERQGEPVTLAKLLAEMSDEDVAAYYRFRNPASNEEKRAEVTGEAG